MIKTVRLVVVFLLVMPLSWSQEQMTSNDLKLQVEKTVAKMEAFQPNRMDPLSLNATIVWSEDKSELAIVMKALILNNWHIYAYVPPSEPYITTEIELDLPKGIITNGEWQTPDLYVKEGGVYVYEGELTFIQYCTVQEFEADSTIKTGLYYQSCDPYQCFPPKTKSKEFTLK